MRKTKKNSRYVKDRLKCICIIGPFVHSCLERDNELEEVVKIWAKKREMREFHKSRAGRRIDGQT